MRRTRQCFSAPQCLVSDIEVSGSVNFSHLYLEVGIDSSGRKLNTEPELFEGEATEMDFVRKIFTACGPYVCKIFLMEEVMKVAEEKDLVEQLSWHVFKYCRNVEELVFWRYEPAMTK